MQQVFRMRGEDGQQYDVPANEMGEFSAQVPNAGRVNRHIGTDGQKYDVPEAESADFKAAVPDAAPMRSIRFANGEARDFTLPELSKFLRSKEWREGEKYAEDRAANEQRSAAWAGFRGFMGEMAGQAGADAATIRDTAEATRNPLYKGYAYAQDLSNSILSGFLGAGSKVTEGVGHALGDSAVGRALVEEGRAGQEKLQRALPTDVLDTSGGGVVDKVLQTGKNVAAVTGEFAPAALPGVGQAYAASIVSAGAVNKAAQIYDEATANGLAPDEAMGLAGAAGAVDAVGNMLLMGAFKGVWKGAEQTAANAVKQSMVRRLVGGTARTGAIMGGQAAVGDVYEQAAENPKGEYDPMRSMKRGMEGFVEGGMFHLVNSGVQAAMHPTQWKSEAKGMPDGMARDALDTPEGRSLVEMNAPDATRTIIEARQNGKDVSRKMLREMGIPESVAPTVADRNALGDTFARDYAEYERVTKEVLAEMERGETRDAAMDTADAQAAEAAHEERGRELRQTFNEAAEQTPAETPVEAPTGAPREEGTTTPPKPVDAPQGGKTAENGTVAPRAEPEAQKTAVEPPVEPPVEKPKNKGLGKYSRQEYDADPESNATGALNWHRENGDRVYSIPVDYSQTAPGGRVVLNKADSAYERIKEVLGDRLGKLRLSKTGKLYFSDGKGVPKELRELFGRELKAGSNPDAPSADDLYGVRRVQTDEARVTTWEDVEQAVAADRANYDAWKVRRQKTERLATEDRKWQKDVKSGKRTQMDYDIWKAERQMEEYREELDRRGVKPEEDETYLAMRHDIEVMQEGGAYDYERMAKEQDAGRDAEWEGAIGEIESGDPTFGKTSEYVKPFSHENLQKAKQGDIIHFDHDKVEYELDAYDPKTGVMTVMRTDEGGVRRRFKVSRNEVKEIRNDVKGQEGAAEADAGDARGGGRSAAGASAKEGAEGARGEAAQGDAAKRTAEGEDLTLESATPEQLAAEKARREQQAEIKRRQETPLATGKGEAGSGQTLLDLGGAEGEDLFSRTQRTEVGAEATKKVADLTAKAAALAKEYAALSDKEKVSAKGKELERRIGEAWDAVAKAEEAAGVKTEEESAPAAKESAAPVESALTPELRERGLAAMKTLRGDAANPVKELKRMLADAGRQSGPAAERRAQALRDLIEYKEAAAKEPPKEGGAYRGNASLKALNPEEEIAERLDLRRLDPKRRSDPKVLEWAKKSGRTVTDGMVTPDAVRAYDEAMTEQAAKVVNKRWFPDMKIVTHKYGEKIKRGQHVLDLRDTAGRTLGWFDPNSKEVHLLPGADPQTVAHEIMWHGTRQYMTERAAKGDAKAQKFLDMMKDVEKNAPQDIKDIVNRLYARGGKPVDRDTLLNEYGAWFTMKRGGYALDKSMQKAENRNWFAKGLHAVKEMFKDFLIRHGRNRVDISKVDGMTRDEFVDFLAEQFASGKTLGNIKESKPAVSTEETWFQKIRRKTYDQNAAVRDLERDVEKLTGRKIASDDSVEAANALKYGLKEAANMDIQGRMRSLREKLHDGGIHFADLEYYAACKAAAGRDAKIDARNLAKLEADMKAEGATPDEIDAAKAAYRSSNGSHIDPREARRVIAEIEGGSKAQAYKDALAELRKTIDETLQTQVDAGLVGKAAADQWRAEEPDYVPFKNEYDPENGGWNGRGSAMSNFVTPEHRMAKGRQSAAGDIIAHVFMDHQAARHRAIENAVRQKLAKLVKAHPELGTVEKLKPDAVKNIEQSDPNVVIFKQGGDSYAIRLEGTRGAAVANAFTGRETMDMKWADKGFSVYGKKISLRNFTRWSAGMATRYSPTFAVRNTLKDNIELANIIYSERGPIEGTKWMAQYAKLRAETLKNVVNVITGRKLGINGDTLGAALGKYITTGKIDTSTEGGKILDRYIKAGGLIAGGTRSEAFASIKDRLDPKAIEKEMKRGRSKVVAAGTHVLKSVAYLNEYAEMATRVGVFTTEVKGGKSDAEAALFSRRATVDFNRHGDWTPGFNLVRMFSNSTLGATARAAAALGKSRYGMVAMGAMFANGLTQALIDHYANADEDKERAERGEATGKDVSEFDRRTSLFYFRNGDRLYKVAQHESPFSLVKYAGDCVGRWLCGDISGKQMAKNLGVNAAEIAYNFLPMGSINLTSRKDNLMEDFKAAVVSGIVPSVLQPIAEIAFDMDFKGDPVTKKLFDDFASRSHNGKTHTPDWAKAVAEWMQERTGGNAGNHKGVDVAPEVIQKLVEGYGKNLLKDVSTAFSVGEAIVKNDYSGLDPRNTPVRRDFVRPLDGNTQRYYSSMGDYKSDRKEYLAMVSRWTPEERKNFVKAHPWAAHKDAQDMITDIQKYQKMEDGFVKDGRGWKERKTPPTEEQKAKWKATRLRLQAKFLRYAERRGGEH